MTQDACLEDNQAIEKLVDKFTDSKIGAVCGRQLPHHNANALAQHARYFNYPEKVQVTFVKDRPGHDARYAIDSAKIERELGWVPEETFETGLRKTVQWYLDNHQWWERVLSGEYKLGRLGVNG